MAHSTFHPQSLLTGPRAHTRGGATTSCDTVAHCHQQAFAPNFSDGIIPPVKSLFGI